MASAAPQLPPWPWPVADADPPDTETVAEFFGDFEPMRQGRYYGVSDPKPDSDHFRSLRK